MLKNIYLSTSLNPFVFFRQVFEGYGQTETTAAATLQMIGDQTYGEKKKSNTNRKCVVLSQCERLPEFPGFFLWFV